MLWPRILPILALLPFAATAEATPPPIPYCQLNPRDCHPLAGATRAHFLGIMQQVFRAVPKVPGYRCQVARRHVDEIGYGPSERRAVPGRMIENIFCFLRGADPRKEAPPLVINVELSVLAAVVGEGGTRQKEGDPLVFVESRRVLYVFGEAGTRWPPVFQMAVANKGPYLGSVQVDFDAASPAVVDAFAGGFDSAAVSDLLAREARRHRAARAPRQSDEQYLYPEESESHPDVAHHRIE